MKQYNQTKSGNFNFSGSDIPNDSGNSDYIKMMIEVNASEAEIIPYSAPVIPLVDLQATKRDEIRTACAAAITLLFQSSALGSAHSYDCRPEDQANIDTRLSASMFDASPRKIWAHDGVEFQRLSHTTAQLQQVNVDMEAHIESQQSTLETLVSLINAAADQAELDLITWPV